MQRRKKGGGGLLLSPACFEEKLLANQDEANCGELLSLLFASSFPTKEDCLLKIYVKRLYSLNFTNNNKTYM